MIVSLVVGTLMVLVTVLLNYVVLRLTAQYLLSLETPSHPRTILAVVATFISHTLAVWLYAGIYWLMANYAELGHLAGGNPYRLEDYLYFSAVTYTTLGYGDLAPVGHLRLLAGIEALNGLTLIAWSATYTYLTLEKHWQRHHKA